MIHFAYPNVNVEGEDKKEFLGCGRCAVSENALEGYKPLPKIKVKDQEVSNAALILAHESFDKEIRKRVFHKKDAKRVYVGESLHLAYLFALINRARAVRLDIHTDIWCTGSIEVSDDKPFLKAVESAGFQVKLESFLSQENKDMLFIVPEGDIQPEHEDLCSKNNAEILSLEDFKKCLSEDKGIFQKKTVLKVRGDELFSLINLVFELGPNPYKGLQYFDENDADRFFGREDLTQKLFEKYRNIQDSDLRLTAVLGPSGSGKSSAARAGLVPEIRNVSPQPDIAVFRPGGHPLKAFSEASAKINQSAPAVIVIDQFEEIYTQCKDEAERNQFVSSLLHACSAPDSRVSAIIILRTDFLSHTKNNHPEPYNAIAENEIIVKAMTANQIRSVIAEPAKRSGYIFDNKIVDCMIDQMPRSNGSLPLLEFALSEIWTGMEKGNQPDNTLDENGGVGGVLAKRAGKIYENLNDVEKSLTRHIFTELAGQSSDGKFNSRRLVFLDEIVPHGQSLENVKALADKFSQSDARFITLSAEEKADNRITAEIAHEALFEHWGSLKQWLDGKRDVLPLARDLEKAAQDWHVQAQDSDLLWRGSKLDLLKDYHQRNSSDMTKLQHDFFQAAEIKQKRNRRLKFSAIAALVILTFASVIGGFWANRAEKRAVQERNNAVQSEIKAKESQKIAEQERDEADKQRVNAELQATALSSENLFASGKEFDALIEAMRAGKKLKETTYEIKPDIRNRVRFALHHAVYGVTERNRLDGHSDKVNSISFSPDGQLIATASEDKTVKLWRRDSKLLKTLEGHDSGVESVAFSPDGRFIASAGGNPVIIKIWDRSGSLLKSFGKKIKINNLLLLESRCLSGDLVFSPDGKVVIALTNEGIEFWGIDGVLQLTLKTTNHTNNISFSPDGQRILTSGWENIKIWKNYGTLLRSFNSNTDQMAKNVDKVFFSSDGQHLIVVRTSDLRLYDLNGECVEILLDKESINSQIKPNNPFNGVTDLDDFKKRNKEVEKRTTYHSDVQYQSKIQGNDIDYVSFSPDGEIIAIADDSNTIVTLWTRDGKLLKTLTGHSNNISSINFSPDGKTLATASSDGKVKLWEFNGWEQPKILKGHTESVKSVSFSPDGEMIASVSNDDTIKFWNRNGVILKAFDIPFQSGYISLNLRPPCLKFSPDGQNIGVLCKDNIIRLFHRDGAFFKEFERVPILENFQKTHNHPIRSVKFSPDGQMIASSGDAGISLFKYDGTLIKLIERSGGVCLAFSPDSKMIASGGAILQSDAEVTTFKDIKFENFEHTINLWNMDDILSKSANEEKPFFFKGKPNKILKGHNGLITSVNFSPNGEMIVSASTDKTVRLWNKEGMLLKTFSRHTHEVLEADFSPDARLIVSAGLDGLRLWDLSGEQLVQFGGTREVKEEFIGIGIVLEQNSKTMGLHIGDVFENSPAKRAGIKKGDQILAINGKLVVDGLKGLQPPDAVKILTGAEGTNVSLTISNEGDKPFDVSLIREKINYSGVKPIPYFTAKFSPDGQMIVSGGQAEIKFWSLDGKELKNLEHANAITNVRFSRDGQTIAAASFDKIRLLDSEGIELKTVKGHTDQIFDIDFSPDGKTIASASIDCTVKLWNLEGQELKSMDGYSFWIQIRGDSGASFEKKFWTPELFRIKFNSDGKMIASAADGSVKLWNNEGIFSKSIPGDDYKHPKRTASERYFDISFNPDNKTIAVTEVDNTLKIYQIADGTLLTT